MGKRDKEVKRCEHCGKDTTFSSDVTVILVDSLLLTAPYPLIPEGSYRLCQEEECGSLWIFVQKAINSNPELMPLGNKWSKALIIYADMSGSMLNPKRSESSVGKV